MDYPLPRYFNISQDVGLALRSNAPIVALESTVITHGLPYPENLKLAQDMESVVYSRQAVPATIAVLDGVVQVGVEKDDLNKLAQSDGLRKVSTRDFATAISKGESGGTTVAGTLLAANMVGLKVFATGGIGGVHRQPTYDISADLPQLSCTPMVVVCAGAKAILDLPATLEYLETFAVPVLGYQTNEFPAFYSPKSGLPTSARADSPLEIAQFALAHWGMGVNSAVLVVNPLPEEVALEYEDVERVIHIALQDAESQQVRGQQVTPFLLKRVVELTGGTSLQANLGLLHNNAALAAEIAKAIVGEG
jgi:pseudouridine-5'-phosphate glycosidase